MFGLIVFLFPSIRWTGVLPRLNSAPSVALFRFYHLSNKNGTGKPLLFCQIPPAPPARNNIMHNVHTKNSVLPLPQQTKAISPDILIKIPPPPSQTDHHPVSQKPKTHIPMLPLAKLIASSKRYTTVDTESTGLGQNQAITQIGCVEIKNFAITGTQYKSYINPECEVGAEAHKLTGLTWHFLSNYPTFEQISPFFMKFIEGSTLVFHDASNDLKWLKSSLEFYGYSTQDLDQKKFLDTFQIACKLNPKDKKGLRALCKVYGIDTELEEQHDALVDAELLAKLFCKLVRKDDSVVDSTVSQIDMKQFDDIRKTPGENFFRALGIKGGLPSFRFSSNLYHPESKQNYPAVLIPFMQGDACKGVYVRYLIRTPENQEQTTPSKKIFYGNPESLLADIYSGGSTTVFIGNLINALVTRDILLNKELSKDLDMQNSFSIKACVDLAYLPGITFDPNTKEIVILIDPETNHADGKKALGKLLEQCRATKLSLKAIILQDGREEKKLITDFAKNQPEQLVECIRHIIHINNEQELDSLFSSKTLKRLRELYTIKQARKIYETSKPITPNTPAFKYFEKRGITGFLPQILRWSKLYYPWLQQKLPVIIAPMYDGKGDFTAVHQIFCHEDGSPLPKRVDGLDTGKRRNKITWGKASGSAIEFTNTGEAIRPEDLHTVAFVGEGLENTLIVAQTMATMKTVNPTLIKQLYTKFGITDTFTFQSCLGVNDVKQAPLPKGTKTVVLLADNDGRKNLEVNKAVKDSARFFLETGYTVFVSLPFLPQGKEKWDFNDAYLQANEGVERLKAVTNILRDAVEIKKKEELGDDNELLEDSLGKIAKSRDSQHVTQTDNDLQRSFKELLHDPIFQAHLNPIKLFSKQKRLIS